MLLLQITGKLLLAWYQNNSNVKNGTDYLQALNQCTFLAITDLFTSVA